MIDTTGEHDMNEPEVIREQHSVAVSAPNPMQMIADAVAQGADVDKLSKLMDLQERWQKEEARKAFINALNEFKANPPDIFKNKSVAFGQGKTSYKHATLDQVSGVIGAALSKVGISHRWNTEQLEGGTIKVTCVLTHAMGHSEATPLQASPDTSGSKNSIQAVGSTVTYLQRYTLLSATGMAVQDQDDDGRGGKRMPEAEVEHWHQRIAAVQDDKEAGDLWKAISKATTIAGDVEANNDLRSAMVAKRKALKEALPL
jgi:hypothetical protein